MTTFEARPPGAVLTTGVRSAMDPVAVTPHHLASSAALDIMRAGGNAVDGAIAANAVQGVVAPETCGIGGDLFALIHAPGDTRPRALNSSGRAGSGISASQLRNSGESLHPRHPATITTPGCVDGWIALADRAGDLPLAATLAPAIELASRGFSVSRELETALVRYTELIGREGSASPLYPGGNPAKEGQTVTRPGLSRTLSAIAEDGRDGFYSGNLAGAIVAATEGIVTIEDLSRDNAEWVDPIGVDVFRQRAWTIPPNSQGYLALAAVWLFTRLDAPRDPSDPGFFHAAIEAYRAVAWERDDLVADPDTAPLSPEVLLDEDRLGHLLASISMDRSGTFPAPAPAPGGTAYLCTRDANGMGVSLIQSNFWGIGSGRSAGATGVFLHNRGAGFTLTPGHPNEFTPGRRPLHTLSPTLWTRNDRLSMLLGTRGGQYQPQLIVQLATAMLRAGMSPAEAQHAARWQVDDTSPGARPTIRIESRVSPDLVASLRELGHVVEQAEDWEPGWGPVSIITESDGLVSGAADPRVSTTAAL